MSAPDYKTTGVRGPQKVASIKVNTSAVIAAPGPGKHIVITDAMNCSSGEGSNSIHHSSTADGNLLFFIPDEGVINFNSPVEAPANTSIWTKENNMFVSLCYYIVDRNTGA